MKKYKFYILLVITILCMTIILTRKEFQNDTFYTIKVGEQIFKTGIDMKDHFSWMNNLSYTYPHWLYDVIIFLIYNLFGFTGIYISTLIFANILLFTMYFTLNNIIKNKGLSYILVVILGLTLKNFITARAQLISFILFLLILYFIEKLRENGKKIYIYYIFIFSLLIANFHSAVFPFIFALFLPYIVSDFLFLFFKKINKNNFKKINLGKIEIDSPKNFKKIIIAFLASLLSGIFTPNFPIAYTYFIKTKMGITMSYITEHLPTTIDKRPEFFIIIGILIILVLQRKIKISLNDLFLLGGLSFLTLMSKRSYALFAILSIFSIGRIINQFFNAKLKKEKIEEFLNNDITFITFNLLFIISSVLIINSNISKDYINYSKYPEKASNYILENLNIKNIRIYNEYNFGSYLLFKNIPVFIDSRADLYTEEFNKDCTIFKDGVVRKASNYEEIFSKYKISHILIYNTNILNTILKNDNNYRKIYIDKYFSIYEKLT